MCSAAGRLVSIRSCKWKTCKQDARAPDWIIIFFCLVSIFIYWIRSHWFSFHTLAHTWTSLTLQQHVSALAKVVACGHAEWTHSASRHGSRSYSTRSASIDKNKNTLCCSVLQSGGPSNTIQIKLAVEFIIDANITAHHTFSLISRNGIRNSL